MTWNCKIGLFSALGSLVLQVVVKKTYFRLGYVYTVALLVSLVRTLSKIFSGLFIGARVCACVDSWLGFD